MSSDGAVTDRIADAEQSKSLIDLIIIKKALIGLVTEPLVTLPAQVEQAPARQE